MGRLLTVARTNIGDREIFLQDYRLLGYAPDGTPVHLVITDSHYGQALAWRMVSGSGPAGQKPTYFKRHVE